MLSLDVSSRSAGDDVVYTVELPKQLDEIGLRGTIGSPALEGLPEGAWTEESDGGQAATINFRLARGDSKGRPFSQVANVLRKRMQLGPGRIAFKQYCPCCDREFEDEY